MKLLLLFLTISCASSYAAPIRVGMDLDLLIHGMAKAKYAGGYRAFIFGGRENPTHSTSWTLDQGVLLATFDGKTRKITSLFYTLNCGSDKPVGESFQLRVEWFDCESGQILIQTKRGEQGGARQPATAPDSKSEGKEKPKPESKRRSP